MNLDRLKEQLKTFEGKFVAVTLAVTLIMMGIVGFLALTEDQETTKAGLVNGARTSDSEIAVNSPKSKSEQYQEGIRLLEQGEWEKAIYAFAGLNHEASEILYNYACAEDSFSNENYYSAEVYLQEIPETYKGPLSEKVLARKHQLLSQLPALKKEQLKKESDLEVLSWKWYRSSNHFVEAVGEVKNISGRPLENVTAVVSFYAGDGTFITSSHALIEYNPILPGQVSPFRVIETYNPEMKKANLQFKFLFGGTIASFQQ
ncbi:MAG: hypothetical protein H5U02_01480 [Clostridia bacterium]|nr:hypothetical protein [Clostridia bacterium]